MTNKYSRELFPRIEKKKVFEDIAILIRDLIEAGTLKPGDQLPPERELADKLGVSRTSVREAIRALEIIGEVETRVGISGGTFIREISLNHALGVFLTLAKRTKQHVSDVVEVRLILETRTAWYAAQRRTEEDLIKIREAVNQMRTEIQSGEIGMKADHAFHLAVAKAAGNEFLYGLLSVMEDLVEETRLQSLSLPGIPEEAVSDHELIVSAIRDRDSPRAEAAMRTHLVKAYDISLKANKRSPQA
jgi:GntR family transcriptional repressor for pyruvate dehydrogenase complex